MRNKYRRKINLKKHFKSMFFAKQMFDLAVENKNIGNALFWANSIKFWRNETKGLKNEN